MGSEGADTMRVLLASLLCFISFADICLAHTQGWSRLFEDEISEFHDEELSWEQGGAGVPSWLQGRYIKNGPARLKFPNQTRFYTNWMDGWGKLHSFTFKGPQVTFSGKLLEPPLYQATLAAGDLVPATTLAGLTPTDWTLTERMEIATMYASQTAYDNQNVLPYKIGETYFAATDWPMVTYFDPATLDTLGVEHPKQVSTGQCAHWIRETGTENTLNFQMHLGLLGTSFHLYRWKPEDAYREPEEVAHFSPELDSVIHSFSVTETHAIFFFYPFVPNIAQMWAHNFHAFEVMEWHQQDMEVAVINLADGHVDRFHAPPTFSAHHANAYNLEEGKFVLDLCPTAYENFAEYMLIDNIANPPEETSANVTSSESFTRYIIDVEKQSVTPQGFDSPEEFPQFNQFDFPTINENYRGKSYCWVYGWVALDYSRHTLIKRNVCGQGGEKMFSLEDQYYGEASFVANPDGVEEDDGVLVTIGFDGPAEQSYIMLLNATDMTTIDRAYTQHIVPFSFHGIFFMD